MCTLSTFWLVPQVSYNLAELQTKLEMLTIVYSVILVYDAEKRGAAVDFNGSVKKQECSTCRRVRLVLYIEGPQLTRRTTRTAVRARLGHPN